MAGRVIEVVGGTDPEKHWPRVLIFDANVFLDLAKVPGNVPVLNAIRDAVKDGKSFNLVIPEPVLTAIQDLQDAAIKQHWSLRRRALREAKAYLRDIAVDADQFESFTESLNKTLTEIEQKVPESVTALQDLLAAGEVRQSNAAHFEEAGKRFIEKRAPAHERATKGRQHISIFKDCLIWSIVKEIAEGDIVEFVTSDLDFTDPEHNEKLHPDLAQEISHRPFKFHTLDDFVKVHINEKLEVVPPPAYDPISDGVGVVYKQCPVCGSESIQPALIPGPSQFGGWSYRQFCPSHKGYVDTGEPFDE